MPVTLCITSGRLHVPVENHDCIFVGICLYGFVCKWLYIPALHSLLAFSGSV